MKGMGSPLLQLLAICSVQLSIQEQTIGDNSVRPAVKGKRQLTAEDGRQLKAEDSTTLLRKKATHGLATDKIRAAIVSKKQGSAKEMMRSASATKRMSPTSAEKRIRSASVKGHHKERKTVVLGDELVADKNKFTTTGKSNINDGGMVHYMVGIAKRKDEDDTKGEFFFDAGYKGLLKVDPDEKRSFPVDHVDRKEKISKVKKIIEQAVDKYLMSKDGQRATLAPTPATKGTTAATVGDTINQLPRNQTKPQGFKNGTGAGHRKGKGKSVPIMTANGPVNVMIYEEDTEYSMNGEVKAKEARTASLTLDPHNNTTILNGSQIGHQNGTSVPATTAEKALKDGDWKRAESLDGVGIATKIGPATKSGKATTAAKDKSNSAKNGGNSTSADKNAPPDENAVNNTTVSKSNVNSTSPIKLGGNGTSAAKNGMNGTSAAQNGMKGTSTTKNSGNGTSVAKNSGNDTSVAKNRGKTSTAVKNDGKTVGQLTNRKGNEKGDSEGADYDDEGNDYKADKKNKVKKDADDDKDEKKKLNEGDDKSKRKKDAEKEKKKKDKDKKTGKKKKEGRKSGEESGEEEREEVEGEDSDENLDDVIATVEDKDM